MDIERQLYHQVTSPNEGAVAPSTFSSCTRNRTLATTVLVAFLVNRTHSYSWVMLQGTGEYAADYYMPIG